MSTENTAEEQDMLDAMKNLAEATKRLVAENTVTYTNAPTDLDEAIERLYRVEILLEDLARGAELAEIVQDPKLTNVFRLAAEEYLVNKLQEVEKETKDLKIQINDYSNVGKKEEAYWLLMNLFTTMKKKLRWGNFMQFIIT